MRNSLRVPQLLRGGLPVAVALLLASTVGAYALSEIKREDGPPPPSDISPKTPLPPVGPTVPPPDPVEAPSDDQTTPPADDPNLTVPDEEPDQAEPDQPEEQIQPEEQAVDPNAPLPEIIYDIERLPEPVRRMRQLILDACASGDIEKLRPLIGIGDEQTQLSFGDTDGDPITFLKSQSGDSEGHEILAIMEEILSAGFVHMDAGTASELYVWPYFFAVPLQRLTPPQRVELFKIVTGGDYEEMKGLGGYTFYRVGISPEGRWAFFVAGD